MTLHSLSAIALAMILAAPAAAGPPAPPRAQALYDWLDARRADETAAPPALSLIKAHWAGLGARQRLTVASALAALAPSAARNDWLIERLADRSEGVNVRYVCGEALGARDERKAVLPLLDAFAEGHPTLAMVASESLTRWVDERPCQRRLRRLVGHDKPAIRRRAVALLGHAKQAGGDKLILAALTDEAPEVVAAAMRAAGQRRLDKARAALRDGLTHVELEVRIAAATGLAAFGELEVGSAARVRGLLTRSRDAIERATLAELLGQIAPLDDRAAAALLRELTGSTEMAVAAAANLACRQLAARRASAGCAPQAVQR